MTLKGKLFESGRAGESKEAIAAEAERLTPIFKEVLGVRNLIDGIVGSNHGMMNQAQKDSARVFLNHLDEIAESPGTISRGHMDANDEKNSALESCYEEGTLNQTAFKKLVVGGETMETEAMEASGKKLQKGLEAVVDAAKTYNERRVNTSGELGGGQAVEGAKETFGINLDTAFNNIFKAMDKVMKKGGVLGIIEEREKHALLAETYGEARKVMNSKSVSEAVTFLRNRNLEQAEDERASIKNAMDAAQEQLVKDADKEKKAGAVEEKVAAGLATEMETSEYVKHFKLRVDALINDINNMQDSAQIRKVNATTLMVFGAARVLKKEFRISLGDARKMNKQLEDINEAIAVRAKFLGKRVIQKDISEEHMEVVRQYLNRRISDAEEPIRNAFSDAITAVAEHYGFNKAELYEIIIAHMEDLDRYRRLRRDLESMDEPKPNQTVEEETARPNNVEGV